MEITASLRRIVGRRGRTIVRTGAWSVIAKACGAANLFATLPFVLHALGPSQFGAWATLTALVGLAGFLDFGFGNGTMNLIAGAHGRGAQDEIRIILREGLRTLRRIAYGVALASVVLVMIVPWHRLLGLPQTDAGEARLAAAIILTTITLGIPLNMAARAQLGLNRGNRAYMWQSLGSLLTLLIVIVCARAGASLPVLLAAAISTPLLASLANTIDLHGRLKRLNGEPPTRNPEIASRIQREGALFFVLQLAVALAYASDLPLIAALVGATEAGQYAIVQRLFSIIPMGLSLIWVPLWPIYRQALAAGDHAWVRRTLLWSIVGAACIAATGALGLAFGFDVITHLWLKHPLAVGCWLVAGFALWCVVEAAGTAIATFLNAASIVRYQVVVATLFATACLATKAAAIGHLGIAAVPWATIATYSLISFAPTILMLPRLLAHATSRQY